jgi:LysM repeat protein
VPGVRKKGKTMQENTWSPVSIYRLIIIGFLFLFMGCVQKPVEKISVDKARSAEQEMEARKHAASGASLEKPALAQAADCDQVAAGRSATDPKTGATGQTRRKTMLQAPYVVKAGDSLWWIAKYRDIYNDPYLWPILYNANTSVIKDPDKIYPGMKLQIPRAGYTPADIQKARQQAGARKPYNPPARAVPPAD